MNKGGLKTLLYTVLTIAIIVLCVSFFVTILPYLLIGGVVIWAAIKIIGAAKGNRNKKDNDYSSSTYSRTYESKENETVEEILEDVSEVIDVDYKDVN